MNKRLIFVAVAVLGIAIATFVYLSSQNKEAVVPVDKSKVSEQKIVSKEAEKQGKGMYVHYIAEDVAKTKDTKILFFHAPWCPQCRQLEASIKKGEIPAGVVIYKVDYDTSQELRKKYGVTIQTTLVRIDDLGNLVEKYVAYQEPTLGALKQNLLQ